MKKAQILRNSEFMRFMFVVAVSVIIILFFFSVNFISKETQVADIDEVVVNSEQLGESLILKVYKPSGYTPDKEYPVLYFIADYGETGFSVMDDYMVAEKSEKLIADGEIEPMIIVGVNMDKSYGLNSAKAKETVVTSTGVTLNKGMYMDYLCKEVIPLIDEKYSTQDSKGGRYIGGYGMGGFAALYIAFNNQELFSKVGGHNPPLYTGSLPDTSVNAFLYPNSAIRKQRDPLNLVQDKLLTGMKVYLDVAAGTTYGVKTLSDMLISKGIDTQYYAFGTPRNPLKCVDNMEEYLKFYGAFEN